jgi:PAS domain S-box-containing protein
MSKTCEEFRFNKEDADQFIMHVAEEGVVVLNQEAVVVFVNKRLLSMMGYSREEMLLRDRWNAGVKA